MRRALVAALPLLLITAACGHESPDTTPKSTNGSSEQGTDTNAQPAAPGEFGTLKGVCGRGDGKTVPSDARGVTDDEIQVGVLNDATSTLAPGLGAEYLAVAKAFTEWCNAAGGINGRKIKFVTRDAKVTEAAARIVDACQSDFMLVGGATPFDAPTVEPREECDLGAIPAYAASPEATTSKLQALPTRVPAKQANVAAIRLLENEFGDAFERTGMLAVDGSPASSEINSRPVIPGMVMSVMIKLGKSCRAVSRPASAVLVTWTV